MRFQDGSIYHPNSGHCLELDHLYGRKLTMKPCSGALEQAWSWALPAVPDTYYNTMHLARPADNAAVAWQQPQQPG